MGDSTPVQVRVNTAEGSALVTVTGGHKQQDGTWWLEVQGWPDLLEPDGDASHPSNR